MPLLLWTKKRILTDTELVHYCICFISHSPLKKGEFRWDVPNSNVVLTSLKNPRNLQVDFLFHSRDRLRLFFKNVIFSLWLLTWKRNSCQTKWQAI